MPPVALGLSPAGNPGFGASVGAVCGPELDTGAKGIYTGRCTGHCELVAIHSSVIEEASKYGGFITRAQVEALGVGSSAIDRRIRNGDFVVVARGIYQIIRSEENLDLVRGAVLTLPGAIASHQSAAQLLDFPHQPKALPTVTVRSSTTHRFPGVLVRRTSDLMKSHVTLVTGIPVTNVARTVFDLAGIMDLEELDRIVESLIISNRLKIRHLELVSKDIARRGKRGTANIRQVLSLRGDTRGIDPTILERRGRLVLADHALPTPVAQFRIPWDPARRFDDAYPDHRVAIEWDSRAWHTQREAMTSDRRRDREAAENGWVVLRFTWDDLINGPTDIATTVRSIIDRRSA